MNSQLLSMINISAVVPNTKIKLKQFAIDLEKRPKIHPNLKQLLNQMLESFKKKINMCAIIPVNINMQRKVFIDFDEKLNSVSNSRFANDISKMSETYSIEIKIGDNIIRVNFILDNIQNSIGYIASIAQSIHTFCYTFPCDYNGLTIDISLDGNNRDLVKKTDRRENIGTKPYNDIFEYQHKKSAAFNVSGMTIRSNKHIILTKSEEIIKLLYHEMVHFVGLDHELLKIKLDFPWAVENPTLNLSEAYTEFMSVLLNTAYQVIQLSGIKKINIYEYYEKLLYAETRYSLYLTTNILKFFGYNNDNYRNFFNGRGEKKYVPILVWEYIIVRTQLLLEVNKIANLVGNDLWCIKKNNIESIVNIMRTDNNLINELSFFMKYTKPIDNISYTIIDFDWTNF